MAPRGSQRTRRIGDKQRNRMTVEIEAILQVRQGRGGSAADGAIPSW